MKISFNILILLLNIAWVAPAAGQQTLPFLRTDSPNFASPAQIRQVTQLDRIDFSAGTRSEQSLTSARIDTGSAEIDSLLDTQFARATWINHFGKARGRLGLRVSAARIYSTLTTATRDERGLLQQSNELMADELVGSEFRLAPVMAFTLGDLFTIGAELELQQTRVPLDKGELEVSLQTLRMAALVHFPTLEMGVVLQPATSGSVKSSDQASTAELESKLSTSQGAIWTAHVRSTLGELLTVGVNSQFIQVVAKGGTTVPMQDHWQHTAFVQLPVNEELQVEAYVRKRDASHANANDSTADTVERLEMGMGLEFALTTATRIVMTGAVSEAEAARSDANSGAQLNMANQMRQISAGAVIAL